MSLEGSKYGREFGERWEVEKREANKLTNESRSFSAVDEPHPRADLEHLFLPLLRLILPKDLPDSTETWRKFRQKMAHPDKEGGVTIFYIKLAFSNTVRFL